MQDAVSSLGVDLADRAELTVDALAQRVGIPVRTIREYQTMALLPPPERRGRVGIYGSVHLDRLRLIARLQERGYSLAGIRDLLASWSEGADLSDVLGIDPLVHLDEPGARATSEQLARLLPDVVPIRLDDVLATGVIEARGPDQYCVPSPSLLQLTIDALAAGYPADRVLAFLSSIHSATDALATATIAFLGEPPTGDHPERTAALATRGRGLLAHGVGRLTVHTIGTRLGIDEPAGVSTALELEH